MPVGKFFNLPDKSPDDFLLPRHALTFILRARRASPIAHFPPIIPSFAVSPSFPLSKNPINRQLRVLRETKSFVGWTIPCTRMCIYIYMYIYIQRVKRLTCKLIFTSAFPSYPIQLISINVHKLPLRNRNSRLLRSLSKEPKFHSIKVLIKVVACKEVPHAGRGRGRREMGYPYVSNLI